MNELRAAGITGAQIAATAGVSPSQVSALLAGHRRQLQRRVATALLSLGAATMQAGPDPVDEASAHLQRLLAGGATYAGIARACGVGEDTLRGIAGGARPLRRTATALLAVDGSALSDRRPVSSDLSRRRVQALLALGWRHADIARAAGMSTHPLPERIRPEREQAIRTAYTQLSAQLGPSAATAARARRYGYEPPQPWRHLLAHLKHLQRAHITLPAISRASGLTIPEVRALTAGGGLTIPLQVAAAVVGVDVDAARAVCVRTVLPAIGAQRRVEALLAMGWRHSDIAAVAGMHTIDLPRGRTVVISAPRHAAVCAAYTQLSMQTGPAALQARRWARAAGYAPPLAWDEETIDAPAAEPVGIRPASTGSAVRPRPRVEVVEDAADLADFGEVLTTAARRMDMRPAALERALHRAARSDLVAALKHPDAVRERVS